MHCIILGAFISKTQLPPPPSLAFQKPIIILGEQMKKDTPYHHTMWQSCIFWELGHLKVVKLHNCY